MEVISIEKIKQLREEIGVSPTEIKKALEEAGGDFEKAKGILRVKGKNLAGKKQEREAKQGIIDYYLHPNLKTGVLLDIRCESDFVAKSPDFKNLAHEICLQIAAMKPLFISENDIPQEAIDGETKIYKEQTKDSGKPEDITTQIIQGKLKKYKESVCLLNQPWIKSDSLGRSPIGEAKTVKNLVEETVARVGENIEIRRFTRYEV